MDNQPPSSYILATVIHSYEAKFLSELSLVKGESIRIFTTDENGWCTGMNYNKECGKFPSFCVKADEKKRRRPSQRLTTGELLQIENIGKTINTNKPWELLFKAKVLFDYTAKTKTELTLHRNDIINVYNTQNEYRWVGEVSGNIGQFPSQLVKRLSINSPEELVLEDEGIELGIALYNYDSKHDEEISFQKGDKILILKEKGQTRKRGGSQVNGWRKGISKEILGLFPSEYVKEIDFKILKKEDKITAIVLYSFKAQGEGELTLNVGDLVHIIESGQTNSWWFGELNGSFGHFPGNFVEIIYPNKKYCISTTKSNSREDLDPVFLLPPPSVNENKHNAKHPSQRATSFLVSSSDQLNSMKIFEGKKNSNSQEQSNEMRESSSSAASPSQTSPSQTPECSEDEFVGVAKKYRNSIAVTDAAFFYDDNSLPSLKRKRRKRKTVQGSSDNISKRKDVKKVKKLISYEPFDAPHADANFLSFPKGTKIKLVKKYRTEWWKGEINGKRGYFPSLLVRKSKVNSPKIEVLATQSFQSSNLKNLSFHAGDSILLFTSISNQFIDEQEFSFGYLNGFYGYFPNSLVVIIPDNIPLPTPPSTPSPLDEIEPSPEEEDSPAPPDCIPPALPEDFVDENDLPSIPLPPKKKRKSRKAKIDRKQSSEIHNLLKQLETEANSEPISYPTAETLQLSIQMENNQREVLESLTEAINAIESRINANSSLLREQQRDLDELFSIQSLPVEPSEDEGVVTVPELKEQIEVEQGHIAILLAIATNIVFKNEILANKLDRLEQDCGNVIAQRAKVKPTRSETPSNGQHQKASPQVSI